MLRFKIFKKYQVFFKKSRYLYLDGKIWNRFPKVTVVFFNFNINLLKKMKKQINNTSNTDPAIRGQASIYRTIYNNMELRLVNMDLGLHVSFMHRMSRHYYASAYWRACRDFSDFYRFYEAKQKSNRELLLIAYLEGKPIGLLEIYPVKGSLLQAFYPETTPRDFMFHMIMVQYRELRAEFGFELECIQLAVIQGALKYLFCHIGAENIYARPHKGNVDALRLLGKIGFDFIQEVMLPDKEGVLLFGYNRADFLPASETSIRVNQLNLFADRIGT